MTLHYEIKFFDYWHLSSGLSAGAKLDSTVVKDADGLPYAPGKTIKGLVKEMADTLGNSVYLDSCYFTNAVVQTQTAQEIKKHSLQENLYDVIASTKIDEKSGVAQDNSLREIEVVVPISLFGEIQALNENHEQEMIQTLTMIKRMGLNRNRGLGRCEFKIVELAR